MANWRKGGMELQTMGILHAMVRGSLNWLRASLYFVNFDRSVESAWSHQDFKI